MYEEEITKRIFTDKRKEFVKFLNKEFSITTTKEIKKVKDKIAVLDKLEDRTLEYGITRMNSFEDALDSTKTLAPLVVMVTTIVTAYGSLLSSLSESKLGYIYSFVSLFVIFIILFIILEKNMRRKRTVVHFKNLLEFALNRKDDKNLNIKNENAI